MRPLILVILLMVFVVPMAVAETPARHADALQAVLDEFLAENEIAPGVSAYVECPGLGVTWAGAAGTVSREDATPLTAYHTFRIASNTKTYVATAVLRLAEQNRLHLDQALFDWLRCEWKEVLREDGYDIEAITLRQVLSHTSGLAEHSGDARYGDAIVADPYHQWTRDEQIRLCAEWCEPVGEPGERYRYSDTGYIILGDIVEQIMREPLGPAVRRLCEFGRLGLRSTWWEYQEEKPATAGPRAHQYFGDYDTTDWNASFDLYGGGGLLTDAPDLGIFMRKLLKGEVLHKSSSLRAMTGGGTHAYRLGLMNMELGGHVCFGHQGFWNTFAFHVPALDLTVSGSVMNHHATNGKELAARLIAYVSEELGD